MLKLYEFAVLLQPKKNRDGKTTSQGKIVVNPTVVLAEDDEKAQLLAGRAIPEEHMDELDRLTLVVRPF